MESHGSLSETLEKDVRPVVDTLKGIQVEVGKLERTSFHRKAIVISKGWSSIYFALKAQGFKPTAYVEMDLDLGDLLTDANVKVLDKTQVRDIAHKDKAISWWVQGSSEFLEGIIE